MWKLWEEKLKRCLEGYTGFTPKHRIKKKKKYPQRETVQLNAKILNTGWDFVVQSTGYKQVSGTKSESFGKAFLLGKNQIYKKGCHILKT